MSDQYQFFKALIGACDAYNVALEDAEMASARVRAAVDEIRMQATTVHMTHLAQAMVDRLAFAEEHHIVPPGNLDTWAANTWAVRTHKDDPSILPPECISTAFVDHAHRATEARWVVNYLRVFASKHAHGHPGDSRQGINASTIETCASYIEGWFDS